MPRRFGEYLDRLTHRNTHREEPNTYTVNTTVDLNDWQPVRWNATQWFPDNDDTHVIDITQQMLDNAYNNMTVREYEEMAGRSVTPENMLRLVRMSMPNLAANTLVEVQPMDPPRDGPRISASYLGNFDPPEYREYRPSWTNRTFKWDWGGRGHVEYRRGKIIRVKRYCKI